MGNRSSLKDSFMQLRTRSTSYIRGESVVVSSPKKAVVCVLMGIVALSVVALATARSEKVEPASREQAQASAATILMEIEALDRLRRGDVAGAIGILEVSVDANLVILGSAKDVLSDPSVRKILGRAAEYRSRHPRRSDPAVDAQVSEVLGPHHDERRVPEIAVPPDR
jgi:hypothetical protein